MVTGNPLFVRVWSGPDHYSGTFSSRDVVHLGRDDDRVVPTDAGQSFEDQRRGLNHIDLEGQFASRGDIVDESEDQRAVVVTLCPAEP